MPWGTTLALCNPDENTETHTVDTCTDTQLTQTVGLGGITMGETMIGAMKAVGIHDWHGETMLVGMQVVGTRRIGLPHMITVCGLVVWVMYVFVGAGMRDTSVVCYRLNAR